MIFIILLYIFLYVPVVIMMVSSFTSTGSPADILSSASLVWYKNLFKQSDILNAAYFSLKIAFISASFSTLLGLIFGMILKDLKNNFLNLLIVLPVFISEIMIGVCFLFVFEFLNTYLEITDFIKLIIAHVTLGCAYSVNIIRTSLSSIDNVINEAALDLGARTSSIFFHVTLPMVSKSLLISWCISFVLSMDDIIISSFLSNSGDATLPLLVYSRLKLGTQPDLNALSTIIILLSITISLVMSHISYKAIKRN